MQTPQALNSLGLALLACFSTSFAHAASTEALVQSDNFEAAYKQGNLELHTREGDPQFDLAFAKAALRTGNLEDALFALDRVTLLQPDNAQARLLMAETLLALKSPDEALQQLAQVKKPTTAEFAQTDALFANIHSSRPAKPLQYTAWVDYSFGYDSNVNFGTYHDSFLGFGNVVVPLGKAATEQSANYNRIGLGGAVQKTLGAGQAVDAILTLGAKENLGEFFDQQSIRLNTGYSVKHRLNTIRVSFRYEQDEIDANHFRKLKGLLGQVTGPGSYAWNQGWETTTVLGIADLQYPNASVRDTTQYIVGYEGRKQLGNLAHTLRGYYVSENSDAGLAAIDRDVYTANWQVEHTNAKALCQYLPSTLTPFARLTYSYAKHDGSTLPAGDKRQDDIVSLGLGGRWNYTEKMTLRAEYNFLQNASNSSVNDLKRNLFEIGLRYSFL